jgi:hypothetical protein
MKQMGDNFLLNSNILAIPNVNISSKLSARLKQTSYIKMMNKAAVAVRRTLANEGSFQY